MNFYQHTQILAISSICSRELVALKIQQPDWPRAFWPTSQEPDFSQIWALDSNMANNITFHCRSNSEKIIDQILQYI